MYNENLLIFMLLSKFISIYNTHTWSAGLYVLYFASLQRSY